jgi:peptide methionine sulfoxide reductase msrA/msrB
MEPPFAKIDGVLEVIAGYTGGTKENPTYEEVSSGKTGHTEAVKVVYDPSKTPYERLLEVFWRQIDPTDYRGQFADHGSQYRTAIFYASDEQRRLAEKSKEELGKSGKYAKPIATDILPAGEFYPAEEYHQHYYQKNSLRYKTYRLLSGRQEFTDNGGGKR